MRTSEVLNRAADLIQGHGWGVGADSFKAGDSGLCLEGGIMAALGHELHSTLPSCPAYKAVAAHLNLKPGNRLYNWNDATRGYEADSRTAEEVIEVLRATAVIEAAREDARVEVSA